MTYVRPDGEIRTVTRSPDDVGDASKNTCGYPFRASEVDLLVGSEGTLGVLTEVVVEILPYVPEFISILVFPGERTGCAENCAMDDSCRRQ